jgi:hypothetical protein
VPFLADTNILLRILEPSATDYALVRGAVDTLWARGERLCFTLQDQSGVGPQPNRGPPKGDGFWDRKTLLGLPKAPD